MRIEPEHVLEQDRIAADGGIENADVEGPLQAHQRQRDRDHRRAENLDQRSGVVGPHEQRQPAPGHAGRAHFVHRDDEVQPGQDGRESGDEHADRGGDDERVRIRAAERRVERPAGVHAAQNDGGQSEGRASDVNVPAQQIDTRKGQVLGADHHRHEEISKRGWDGWYQEEEHHHDAVHGEELVVGIGIHQVALRGQQFDTDQAGEDPADEEHHGDRDDVEHGDAFMVFGEEPRLPAVFLVQVIGGFHRPWIL